ncbi:olfactory receptor 2AT4-like [Mugil cephalus]|uniref:olfactory receptor 2AT4-like n=1 Tax=Mugil cephalus TaxID=48193 RepID=UPI001FB612B1|nr:olfactory receptor 2AT4-like [Mugil cephalus]
MSFFRTLLNDSVLIRPPGFYIIGFETFPFISVYFIFLAFVYVITVLSNSLVIYIIVVNHCLHTSKFIAVVNLAVIDLVLTTCLIPSMINVFLIKDNFIPFRLCFVQMFVYYTFVSLESYALAILAYDRLVAIHFPLRQNSINTVQSMCCIVGVTWWFAFAVTAFSTGIMARLSFCGSVRVFSYFCDYAPVFRLACNDYTMQWWAASVLTILILVVPFTFILLSYVSILVAVFRMKNLDSRVKALATCVEHLILVAVFYFPLIIIFTIGFYLRLIDPDRRVLSLSLASCLPPCINPIVYSLKTKEIKIRMQALFRKNNVGVDQTSPNSSHTKVFALATALATVNMPSGDPQTNHALQASFFSLTVSHCNQQPYGHNSATSTMAEQNVVNLDSIPPPPLERG